MAGVPVRFQQYDGVLHGFFGLVALLDQSALVNNAGIMSRGRAGWSWGSMSRLTIPFSHQL